MWCSIPKLFCTLLVLMTVQTTWLIIVHMTSWIVFHPRPADDSVDKDLVLGRLYGLQDEVKQEGCSQIILKTINSLVKMLEGNNNLKTKHLHTHDVPSNGTGMLQVCHEKWLGSRMQQPFYFRSWEVENCSNALPIEKVLTVLLYVQIEDRETCAHTTHNVITGIKHLYPTLRIILSSVSNSCLESIIGSDITLLKFNHSTKPGFVWNSMCKLVKTPYVFIARDLDNFLRTASFERQIRMLSSDERNGVAGGAVRNETGHWKIGCFQTSMKNYILEYIEGYYYSKNSCMFCDYLAGPFVARTSLLLNVPFSVSLPNVILFEDWFLRLKQEMYNVINCPDVMYSATDPAALPKMEYRELWFPLARTWRLNRITFLGGNVFSFTCSETRLKCNSISVPLKNSLTDTFLIPICCIEQLSDAIKVLDDFCSLHNILYELDSGSVLGAVKINGIIPWDIDVDIRYYTYNYSVFKENEAYFQRNGIKSKFFSDTYFEFRTPNILIQMWGMTHLSQDTPFGEPFHSLPTRVQFCGHWVTAPINPGAFARGLYGPEILKHSPTWLHVGLKDSFEPYKPGRFNKCKLPGYHACADRFSADGNIQFKMPNCHHVNSDTMTKRDRKHSRTRNAKWA